ncbi:hypothetical protein BBJ29_002788 [Phytophthora kernoviae]|uniref:NAD(+) synthase (glutamine-hydrolyzing) n=1 Tax=Phytophthora kernoviae TaxID=325452 RepID=A0A3F2S540_9STRA|nr:hypothetical protein BBJ29_002788 [Phytophthora kernoviae]RLN69957.1 hypothetical protein BBP00_00000038 [Phytophthora kernoviae]
MDAPELLSAFVAVPDLVPGTRGSGMVMNWQQQAGVMYAGGNSSMLRGWNLCREKCTTALPTQTDSCVTSMASDDSIPGMLVAGFGDGTLRIFDSRSRPDYAVKTIMKEHTSWVVQTHIYAGRNELLSGSVTGELKFWDLRYPKTSVKSLEAHRSPMTALAVHDYAPIFASGSHNQFIKVFRSDGEQLALIRYHEGFLALSIMSALVTVATCNLNQWALDFDGNLERILESIRQAKALGARYRVGPELEVCGYGCEDHFLEQDTFFHCWESLEMILRSDVTNDILCDIGMPVMHNGVRYNCRVFCLNQRILFIRPKLFLADDGNYRETRWFTTWKSGMGKGNARGLDKFVLPASLQKLTGCVHVPIGSGALSTLDTSCGAESCEELFTPDSPHVNLSLAGVEIIGNGSGSHHQLRKLDQRMDLIRGATTKSGGVYLYSNQQGCDGGRMYYDGCAVIVVNGQVVAQGSQFSVKDVEVVTATVDLDDVRSYRGSVSSRCEQASSLDTVIPKIDVEFSLCHDEASFLQPTPAIDVHYHVPEEEIALGPACWMWDYLRRSGGSGFFLPLSGGADSSSVACIVGVMCHLVVEAANNGDEQVIKDVQRIMGTSEQEYQTLTPADLASHVLHTTYMGTKNSSAATKKRASSLASQLGCYHLEMGMDMMVDAVVKTFSLLTGKTPQFLSRGGNIQQDLALQNIQARLRMVMAYLLAQLLPWVRSKNGFLLVLSSGNVDEALRGYMTKYDCSSGDLNPIGAVSKGDLKKLLRWAAVKYNYPALQTVEEAPPTAELRPTDENAGEEADHSQLDEEDMGMTYGELSYFGRLRKIDRCGPYWMFRKLAHLWSHLTPTDVATKVKRFFFYYSINRHKMTTLTPSYHAENYSPDDNRFDLRPFLYNSLWTRQFRSIDTLATKLEEKKQE